MIHCIRALLQASAKQPQANGILTKAMCQMDGAVQLQWIQQVEDSMCGRVSGEKAPGHYLGAEILEAGLRWTSPLDDGSFRCIHYIGKPAALGTC